MDAGGIAEGTMLEISGIPCPEKPARGEVGRPRVTVTPEQARRCFRTFVYFPSGKTAFKDERREEIKTEAMAMGTAIREKNAAAVVNGGSLFQSAWRKLWMGESPEMKLVWETRAKLKAEDHES